MTDDTSLTPDEAAAIAGVPACQLRAWSWDRVGPVNVGTRWRPMYREADLVRWREERSRLAPIRHALMVESNKFLDDMMGGSDAKRK